MKKIRIEKQISKTGCGIACVAMVSEKSYKDIYDYGISLGFWTERSNRHYTNARKLMDLLAKVCVPSSVKKSKSWDDINGLCIVGVNREGNEFHWVVVVKDSRRFYILDPTHGDIYNGNEWVGEYVHSVRPSAYISIEKEVSYIVI